MANTASPIVLPAHSTICQILRELGVPIHRIGYQQLCIAIPRYALYPTQCLTKQLYPYIAEYFGCFDSRSVEHSIRLVIFCAWENGDRAAWAKYFPDATKVPSNKQFIATLAEHV